MPQIIYMITNTVTKKKYIGQTSTSLDKRFRQHINTANSNRFNKMLISRSIKKYGRDKFKAEIIKEFEKPVEQEVLDQAEIEAIAEFNTLSPHGYNQALGGKVCAHSPASRQKNSTSHKSYWESLSEEERQDKLNKMRTERNKIGTNFTRAGMQRKKDYQKDRWANDADYREQMEKTLVKARANNNTEEAKKKRGASLTKNKLYKLTSPEGEEFTVNNLTQFAKPRGLDVSGLQKVAKGKLKHYKQWRCECLNDSGIRDLNKDYRELNKYLLSTPNGIQFCTYGLQHVKEQYGLDPNLVTRSARTGYKHKGWLASKVD